MLFYIMLDYLMLLTALFNAVCLYNACLPLTFANAFCFIALFCMFFVDLPASRNSAGTPLGY